MSTSDIWAPPASPSQAAVGAVGAEPVRVAVGVRPSRPDRLDDFLALSSAITGFSAFRLEATGQAASYLAHLRTTVGDDHVDELLTRGTRILGRDVDATDAGIDVERSLRLEVFSDAALGPIARNLVKLWFIGTWYALPVAWHERHGRGEGHEPDRTSVVSPAAYVEGLLWPTIGANPPGAKAPGYATWADPPRIPDA